MNPARFSRRTAIGGATAALGMAVLGGYRAAAYQGTPVAEPDAFPVTIEHVYGETTITERPERVVTLSWINQDVAIALGVVPVGMPFTSWGGDAEGFLPWTREALGDGPLPTLFNADTELPFEEIAGLKPDVIIGAYSGITQEEYDLLTQIAPTVAYPEVSYGTSWQDTTRIVGQALGLSSAADQLVADTEALLAAASLDYPEIKGKTFTYGTVMPDTGFNIYTAIDGRVQLLSAFGMSPSSFVENLEIPEGQSAYFVPVSFERANEIDGDILVLWFGSQEEADAAAELPTVEGIEAFRNGAYAPIVGQFQVMAVSAPSPLSIPYIVDEYVPQLAAAAANVPE